MKKQLVLLTAATTAILFQNCSKVEFSHVELASNSQLSDPVCSELSPESFSPKLKWDWAAKLDLTKPENYPSFLQVMASPVVGDLNHDGRPEVLFVSWNRAETNSYNGRGILRIVDGATGENLFSVGDPDIAPFATSTPLLIDLDGDGLAEIIYPHYLGKDIVALNYDGSLRWKFNIADLGTSESITNYRSFEAADLDHDGKPELLVGNRVFSENSAKQLFLKWKGSSSSAGHTMAISLDAASPSEMQVITNNAVYDHTGKQLFQLASADYAAADLDNKSGLELVGTGGGRLRIYDGATGQLKLDKDLSVYNELQCPGGIGGGAATIGDFDGDPSTIEIAVATGRYLTIFDSSGNLIAKYPTQDCSSLSTGISSFDFNGDGKPEILYGDEEYLRVFEMVNGNLQVVWQTVNPSGTLNEYPVVADIDGNNSSELLVVSNNYAVGSFYKDANELQDAAVASKITGVRAFESNQSYPWMRTRSLWNSWHYNPALVTDSLQAVSSTSLTAFTSKLFRRNTQMGLFEKKCTVR